jgi:hypothetical protein
MDSSVGPEKMKNLYALFLEYKDRGISEIRIE